MTFFRFPLSFLLGLGLVWFLHGAAGAADLEDFSAGFGEHRITINPASVALLEQIHFQYRFGQYAGGNELSAFTDQAKVNGQSALVLTEENATISGVRYDDGETDQFRGVIAWPLASFAVGVVAEGSTENYENGTLLDNNREELASETSAPDSEIIEANTVSVLLGLPLDQLFVGLRVGRTTIEHKVSRFESFQLGEASSDSSDLFTTDINGSAEYTVMEFGAFLPELFSFLDLGVVYRPAAQATMTLSGFESNLSSNKEFADFEFEDPAFFQIGGGVRFDFGDSGVFQFAYDAGSQTAVDTGATGSSVEAGTLSGFLLRYGLPGLFDVSFGVQNQTIDPLTWNTNTVSVRFPVWEEFHIKVGVRQVKLSNDKGDNLAEASFLLISFDAQFGEPEPRIVTKQQVDREVTELIEEEQAEPPPDESEEETP